MELSTYKYEIKAYSLLRVNVYDTIRAVETTKPYDIQCYFHYIPTIDLVKDNNYYRYHCLSSHGRNDCLLTQK